MAADESREEREARLDPRQLHTLALAVSLEELRAKPEYEANGRTGTTLVKTPDLRVVLEAVRAGARLQEHQAPGPVTIQVLSGELRFVSEGEVIYLREGELLAALDRQPHSVEAVTDSAFLLTIAPEGA
jgi:quercetin dioxygenase-like cupin family protein